MTDFNVVVSVSYGDVDSEKLTKSYHMLKHADIKFTEDEAEIFVKGVVGLLMQIQHRSSEKTVLGIYKVEEPAKQTLQ